MENPRKTTDQNKEKKVLQQVKKAATVLMLALGLTVAGQQDANAQMFSRAEVKKEIAEKKKQNDKKKAEGQQLDKENAETLDRINQKSVENAKLKEQLREAKGNKQTVSRTSEAKKKEREEKEE